MAAIMEFTFFLSTIYLCVSILSETEINSLLDFYHATDGTNWLDYSNVDSNGYISGYSSSNSIEWDLSLLRSQKTIIKCFNNTYDTRGCCTSQFGVFFGLYSPKLLCCLQKINTSSDCTVDYISKIDFQYNPYLPYNSLNLNGTLPISLGNFTNLTLLQIDLGHSLQGLTGSIPNELCNAKLLSAIVLRNLKHLSGEIPQCIFNDLAPLSLIWLESTPNLSGNISKTFCANSNINNNTVIKLLNVSNTFVIDSCICEYKLHIYYRFDFNIDPCLKVSQEESDVLIDLFYSLNGPNWTYRFSQINSWWPCMPWDIELLKSRYIWNYHTQYYSNLQSNVHHSQLLPMCGINAKYLGGHGALTFVESLTFENYYIRNMSGTIPDSIGKLSKMRYLSIKTRIYDNTVVDITGLLPNGLCNTSIEQLYIDNNRIYGNIPYCLLNSLPNLKILSITNTFINGSIPKLILNLFQMNEFILSNNIFLHGQIDDSICLMVNNNFTTFIVEGSPHIYGTVPVCITNNTALKSLHITQSQIHNISAIYSTNLQELVLNNNRIHMNLSDLLLHDMNYSNVISLVLHENDFISNNVSNPLKQIMISSAKTLQIISLFGNNKIRGHFPHLSEAINMTQLQYLLMHDMDLFGSIPSDNNLILPKLKYLTLYNNKLSCDIPPKSFQIDYKFDASDNFNYGSEVIIFYGNLFQCNKYNSFPDWILNTDPFAHTPNIYITKTQ
eukprot:302381_1